MKISANMSGICREIHSQYVNRSQQVQCDHDRHQPAGHRPMRLMPPIMTMPTRMASTMPVAGPGNAEIRLGDCADVPGLEHIAAGRCQISR